MTDEPPPDDVEVTADAFFAIVPEWVLYAPISDKAVRLYGVLSRKADNVTRRSTYSRKALAELMHYKDPKSVDRVVKELEEIGALSVRRRKSAEGDWATNLYTVHSTPKGTEVGAEMPLPRPEDATTVAPENGDKLKANSPKEPPNPPAELGGRKVRRCINDAVWRDCDHKHGKRKCTTHLKHDRDCEACHQRPDPPPPAWCGDCDPLGRIDPTLRVVFVDGKKIPCPRCHPTALRKAS